MVESLVSFSGSSFLVTAFLSLVVHLLFSCVVTSLKFILVLTFSGPDKLYLF